MIHRPETMTSGAMIQRLAVMELGEMDIGRSLVAQIWPTVLGDLFW